MTIEKFESEYGVCVSYTCNEGELISYHPKPDGTYGAQNVLQVDDNGNKYIKMYVNDAWSEYIKEKVEKVKFRYNSSEDRLEASPEKFFFNAWKLTDWNITIEEHIVDGVPQLDKEGNQIMIFVDELFWKKTDQKAVDNIILINEAIEKGDRISNPESDSELLELAKIVQARRARTTWEWIDNPVD
ncbi:hypothetical protein [Marinicella meishanensis]|uniref:hypothetical protein n=1 Tax=Marinicella meishanensis TaxID=2873263 RepID=UPI001CBCCBBB|nr:hypothetical protein [Marinicella sp. NBU2979]